MRIMRKNNSKTGFWSLGRVKKNKDKLEETNVSSMDWDYINQISTLHKQIFERLHLIDDLILK